MYYHCAFLLAQYEIRMHIIAAFDGPNIGAARQSKSGDNLRLNGSLKNAQGTVFAISCGCN